MTVTIGLIITEREVVIEGSTTSNESTGTTDTDVIDETVMVWLLSK